MKQPIVQLCCTGMASHQFNLLLERKEDLTASMVSDSLDDSGYAIFRDAKLVLCPICKAPCRMTGVKAELEVTFHPSEERA